MKIWTAGALLDLAIACPGEPGRGTSDNGQLAFKAVLNPPQTTLRPGATMSAQAFLVQIVRQPDGVAMDLRNWPPATFQWEILNVPTGADGGHFDTAATGSISDAPTWVFVENDPAHNHLSNIYRAPTALPVGTTHLELKLRFTYTFPADDRNYGGMKAIGEAPIILDVNAPSVITQKAAGGGTENQH